ncbi:hypothetical protein D0C36_08835 [Mucilaginibacter conchicola]|uniref:Glycosyltransferase n=1 Tax=Mucilaginibacter conchicola TaxID=2303333 RepID=A0A372NZQ5_9SPHI|nr:hypothetical protein [Mucilaginibacter conchicola]RFZ95605.1 hypothetical protein D0C36_08835 [Mucilaginibacter conchicola]
MSKIVIITSGQPALNPRLVKEADALTEAGHKVVVIYAYWNRWGHLFNQKLLEEKSWTTICAGGNPETNKVIYTLSKIVYKLSTLFTRLTGKMWLAEWAIGRPAPFLMRAAAKQTADLYIGHNLAALPATIKAAKKQKQPCGFDAEDLHRYEVSSDPNHPDVILKSFIEDKYLPQLDYLTVSSQPIGSAYQQLFPLSAPKIVRNVFPKSDITPPPLNRPNMPIRLFWFSQTLGSQRGLQDIAGALAKLSRERFELHLLCDQPAYTLSFKKELIACGINIFFYDPLPADQIVAFASQFDIGLATEPGFSINNDFALSNKLFTYLQAGLFIIASATTAQKAFIEQYPDVGSLFQSGNIQALITLLSALEDNPVTIKTGQAASIKLARTELNWEAEKLVFLSATDEAMKR